MMKSKMKRAVVYFLITVLLLSNQMIATAAEAILAEYLTPEFTAESVGSDLYLIDVITLDNNKSYVGIVKNVGNGTNCYAISNDMVNWEIKSEYFSLVHGGGRFVGLADKDDKTLLCYTTDGLTWSEWELPGEYSYSKVYYENGYFKLFLREMGEDTELWITEDLDTWYNITNDVPKYCDVRNVVFKDGKAYSLAAENEDDTGFKLDVANDINEYDTNWEKIELNGLEEYSYEGYMFDGESLYVHLINEEEEDWAAQNLYYMTTDFVNWEEKFWDEDCENFYDENADLITTDERSVEVDGKKFEDFEIHSYRDGNDEPYYISYAVYSVNGTEWIKEQTNIFVNGEKVTRDAGETTDYDIPENYEWARSSIEYAIGRGYEDRWVCEYLADPSSRLYSLGIVMRALNIMAPEEVPKDFVPFEDVDPWDTNAGLIQRAKMLGLVNGVDGINFNPDSNITRQDMMVIVYNLLKYVGGVEEDTSLSALEAYRDKDEVSEYAKIAVSSLSKAGIIQGDGISVNPMNNVTNVEMMIIAEKINKYRMR